MAITTTKLKEIMEKTEKMNDDVLILQMQQLLKSFRLDVRIEDLIDKGLDELLKKTPDDLVDSTWDVLQKYLIIVNKWSLFIRRQINLREVYFSFVAKRKYDNLMRQKKITMSNKEYNSEKAKEEKLLTIDKEIEAFALETEIAEAYFKLLKGFDAEIEHWHFSLQNIIRRKEREWMVAHGFHSPNTNK